MSTMSAELPYSAKIVFQELCNADADQLTRKELAELTDMPDRTVNYALRALHESGQVDVNFPTDDLSTPHYCVTRKDCERAEG